MTTAEQKLQAVAKTIAEDLELYNRQYNAAFAKGDEAQCDRLAARVRALERVKLHL